MSNKQKYCTEMDFQEFWEWATRAASDAVITGGFKELKASMHLILNQAAQNEVWGGNKGKRNG